MHLSGPLWSTQSITPVPKYTYFPSAGDLMQGFSGPSSHAPPAPVRQKRPVQDSLFRRSVFLGIWLPCFHFPLGGCSCSGHLILDSAWFATCIQTAWAQSHPKAPAPRQASRRGIALSGLTRRASSHPHSPVRPGIVEARSTHETSTNLIGRLLTDRTPCLPP
jgi:hypothetical protein